MSARALETTPAMVAQALAAFSPMELAMTMEAWLIKDAGNAHELLELVRQQNAALAPVDSTTQAYDSHDAMVAVHATLDAAAPWIQL